MVLKNGLNNLKRNNMKQTAVEWLQVQLNKILIDNQIQQTEHLFEQAKAMEKEQIIKAYENTNSMAMYGEQYYNETFNTKNQ